MWSEFGYCPNLPGETWTKSPKNNNNDYFLDFAAADSRVGLNTMCGRRKEQKRIGTD